MKQYLVKITPQEPYFFGNERSYKYPDCKNGGQLSSKYFIKSEKTPAQSTIAGMMRYILLPVKKADFAAYTDEDKLKNAAAVGEESYLYGKEGQSFGLIKEISPVFIINGEDFLVPAPFNHIPGEKTYTPFSKYKSAKTPDGEFLYTEEYNPKNGIFSGYMRVPDGKIFEEKDVFLYETRTGTNSKSVTEALYKRQYVNLKSGFSFGVYVTLEDNAAPQDMYVFAGQKKAVFSVSFTLQENTICDKVKPLLRKGEIYCLGDAFIKSEVCKTALFSVIKTRDYRGFATSGGKVSKGECLYKTICAGSIFIPRNRTMLIQMFDNPGAGKIGYNITVENAEETL